MGDFKKSLIISIFILWASAVAQGGDLDGFAGQKGVLKIAGGTAHIPVM